MSAKRATSRRQHQQNFALATRQVILFLNKLLHSVKPAQIKNGKALTDLIGYLERNRPYIPCYSVRKHLGLANSSNRGEKANDLVVSDRQKHNGMSWSNLGSVALAAVTAMVRNQEYRRWFQTNTLSFTFSASG